MAEAVGKKDPRRDTRTPGWAGGLDRRAEPPPAHSIGRVGEDTMGRAGQFVRPCWLGVLVRRWRCVAGGEELVARLVVRLA